MRARAFRTTTSAAQLFRAALVAALVSVGLATAGPALATEGDVTWGVSTASNAQGTDRQNFSYDVDPGGSVNDALVVSNHDTAPLDLDVYAADGFTTTSGQLDLVTRGTASVGVGSWTAADTGHLQIPAGGSATVPFTLTVPGDATPGDYAGGIVTSLASPTQEQGISVDRRLGIRIHLRVGGLLAPALTIENLRVDYAGTYNPFGTGDATLRYTIRNTGNARLSAGQAVSFTGPFGLFGHEASGVESTPELLPGATWDVTASVSGVYPAFWLGATASLTPTLSADVADASGAVPVVAPVVAGTGIWTIPWTLLILVILLAAAVAGAIVLRRRSRRIRTAREETRVQEAVDQALRDRDAQQTPAL
jgi:hypothetical protein